MSPVETEQIARVEIVPSLPPELERELKAVVLLPPSFQIVTPHEFLKASEGLRWIRDLRKKIKAHYDDEKSAINKVKEILMAKIHRCDDPCAALEEQLSKAIGDYQLAEQRRVEEEKQRQQELARQEAMKIQHQRECEALASEMGHAREAMVLAQERNQFKTADEIAESLKAVAKNPANPAQTANLLRQAVALALEREARRIRAEEAKRSGDIEAARKIAHEKIEVDVAPITVEPVEIAPVIVESETPKVEGQHFRTDYVLVIEDEEKVPREFCSPDMKKLKAFATAFQGSREIPGVRIEKKLTPVQRSR